MTKRLYIRNAYVEEVGDINNTYNIDISLNGNSRLADGYSLNSRHRLFPGISPANQAINRSFDTINSTARQTYLVNRAFSSALTAQTIAAQTWTYALCATESNAAANLQVVLSIYIFRPSTSAVVGFIYDSAALLGTEYSTNASSGGRVVTVSGAAVTAQEGDFLVVEEWAGAVAGMATTYTCQHFQGGTVDVTQGGSGTAGYIESTNDFDLYVAPPEPLGGLTDNFDDNVKDLSKWADYESIGINIEETGGALHLSIQPGVTGWDGYYEENFGSDFTNKYAFVKLVQAFNFSPTTENAATLLSVNNSGRLNKFSFGVDGTGRLYAETRINGVYSTENIRIFAYLPAQHKWLRIRESNGFIHFDTAPETADNPPSNAQWVPVTTPIQHGGNIGAMFAALEIDSWDATDSNYGTIIFDGYNTAANVENPSLSGNSGSTSTTTGSLAKSTQLAGGVTAASTTTGSLAKIVRLAGDTTAASIADGLLTSTTQLTGAVTVTGTTAGEVSKAAPFTGFLTAVASATGTVSVVTPAEEHALTGDIAVGATTTGVLTTYKPLAGAVQATATATGAAIVARPLSGSLGAAASTDGSVGAVKYLEGNTAGGGATAGSIFLDKQLAGIIGVEVSATAAINVVQPPPPTASGIGALNTSAINVHLINGGADNSVVALTGSVQVGAAASAAVAVSKRMGGALSVTAQTSGATSTAKPLGASILAMVQTAGVVRVHKMLGANAVATASQTGTLQKAIALSGTAQAQTAAAGSLLVLRVLRGSITGTAHSSASVHLIKQLAGDAEATVALSGHVTKAYRPIFATVEPGGVYGTAEAVTVLAYAQVQKMTAEAALVAAAVETISVDAQVQRVFAEVEVQRLTAAIDMT